MHKCDLVMDFQYGSTGKGLIAGFLAKRESYDTAVCSFATNAGHTYLDNRRDLVVMTQQLPTAITSDTVKTVLLGPGSLIHWGTLWSELERYAHLMKDKRLLIHPHAAIVEDYHAESERTTGRTKMGSTGKGVGDAMIERILRAPGANIAGLRHPDWAKEFVTTPEEYRIMMDSAEQIIVEGAQGFSLSLYHGAYPFTTSRDVTPWQIAADCGLPFKWMSYIQPIGSIRTYPIRVNNRDGFSGPGYSDQEEITWDQIGVKPELTTVTKLPRRLFTFSQQQFQEAMWHCGGYWKTKIFLNFANYLQDDQQVEALIQELEQPKPLNWNHAHVEWIGMGADDGQVLTREQWNDRLAASLSLSDSEGGLL